MDCWLLSVPINRRNDFLSHPTHSATFRRFWYRPWGNLVQRVGLEPTTRRVWVFSSNRLSYLCIAMVAEDGIRTHIFLLMGQHQSQSWFTPHLKIQNHPSVVKEPFARLLPSSERCVLYHIFRFDASTQFRFLIWQNWLEYGCNTFLSYNFGRQDSNLYCVSTGRLTADCFTIKRTAEIVR